MKIRIQNLGVVRRGEIELKPLTIFVGPNNVGKTWVAYTLAGVFGSYGLQKYVEAYVAGRVTETYEQLDNAIQQVINEGNAVIDIVQFAEQFGDSYFNAISSLASSWMKDYMNTDYASFDQLNVEIQLGEKKKFILGRIKDLPFEYGLSSGQQRQRPLLNVLKEAGNTNTYFYTDGSIIDKLPLSAIKSFIADNVFTSIHNALFPQTYVFPSERTAFIFLLSDMLQQRPVGQFLTMIRQAASSRFSVRESQAEKDAFIRSYIELARILEQKVLHGDLEYSHPELELDRELLYKPTKGVSLDIPVVSSMVKELSPLVLYLRYLALPGELLIIDEPEMNLHPAAQVRMIEFLAMLVNRGLHVLITTHSSYMVDHLANLIKASEYRGDKEELARKFFLRRSDAFLQKEKVGAYYFGGKTPQNILQKDGTIDWRSFSVVSDQITQLYLDLVSEETPDAL